jgi:hypothetical protein
VSLKKMFPFGKLPASFLRPSAPPVEPAPVHELLGKRFKFPTTQPLTVTVLRGETLKLEGYHPRVKYHMPASLVTHLIYEGILEEV